MASDHKIETAKDIVCELGYSKLLLALCSTLVLLILFAVYTPLFYGPAEFSGDDDYFIVNNTRVHSLTPQSLTDIWTKPTKSEYFPVTIFSYAVDYAFGGLNPRIFRLTNLIILFLIGLASFSISVRLNHDYRGGRNVVIVAALASFFILLHPTNVESVSSPSHRKELLYALFGLLAVRSYLVSRDTAGYLTTLFLVVLAQLSKGTAVILPVLFLLYDLSYWKDRGLFKKRLPFLVSCFFAVGVIFSYQYSIALKAGVVETGPLSWGSRAGGIARTANAAIENMLLPVNLTYQYDLKWPLSLNVGQEWILPVLLALAAAYLISKRPRYFFPVMLILVPFLPYSNFIPLKHGMTGQMTFYDHYLLFSCFAATPLLTGLGLSAAALPLKRVLLMALSVCLLIMAVYDNRLADHWKTRETLYLHTIEVSPEQSRSYVFLGQAYIDAGRYDDAIFWLKKGLATEQGASDPEFYQLLGDAFAFSERYPQAESYYKRHLVHKKNDLKTLQNLSSTLIMLGKKEEAKEMIARWLELSPGDPAAAENLRTLDKLK